MIEFPTHKELYRQWELSKSKLTFTEWLDKFYPDRLTSSV